MVEGFRLLDSGFRVRGLGFRVLGFGCSVLYRCESWSHMSYSLNSLNGLCRRLEDVTLCSRSGAHASNRIEGWVVVLGNHHGGLEVIGPEMGLLAEKRRREWQVCTRSKEIVSQHRCQFCKRLPLAEAKHKVNTGAIIPLPRLIQRSI